MNDLREMGHHAVRGTKKMPQIKEKREIRLKDTAVAIGAPMKPRRIGSGPQTGRIVNDGIRDQKEEQTKEVIEQDIYGSHNEDDPRWDVK